MKDPAEALAAARRAAGGQGQPDPANRSKRLDQLSVSARRLAEWAIIEPEQAEVYSTRRLGGPITALKRLLIRLLSQYLGQMSAQQSRFNAHIAAHVMRLEERVDELEKAVEHERGVGESPSR
ncbi:MAG: hypothetical protein ACR2JH_05855 [Solirubrobacteraceae bacterium]